MSAFLFSANRVMLYPGDLYLKAVDVVMLVSHWLWSYRNGIAITLTIVCTGWFLVCLFRVRLSLRSSRPIDFVETAQSISKRKNVMSMREFWLGARLQQKNGGYFIDRAS